MLVLLDHGRWEKTELFDICPVSANTSEVAATQEKLISVTREPADAAAAHPHS